MTRALKLYKRHSQAQLLAMQALIEADEAKRNKSGGIHLYTPEARRELSAIAEAISHHMADARQAAGNPVAVEGYSGRQQNR